MYRMTISTAVGLAVFASCLSAAQENLWRPLAEDEGARLHGGACYVQGDPGVCPTNKPTSCNGYGCTRVNNELKCILYYTDPPTPTIWIRQIDNWDRVTDAGSGEDGEDDYDTEDVWCLKEVTCSSGCEEIFDDDTGESLGWKCKHLLDTGDEDQKKEKQTLDGYACQG